ncbi:hypothetical protein KEM60_02561 [Austwickia sp. TVS 96-490-7B]|uniref:RHS repeat domain-containing protein n=1 Tax=Austwickia sp. TVS 96-490-7B TaxID=2830843 RepID=UPI001C586663|nr:RHS repeat domain-containing protein [Austwickia sp. TVS 96-490-7B]MBW3086348.1 hypothetical protein [Austwickia sp. TVS 96-490-7B]
MGQHVRYGYDPSGLLTWSEDQDATGTAGVRREFTYDPTGRLLNATIGDHAPGSLTITRDVLGQVTHESWITPGASTPAPGRSDTTAAVINVSSSYDRAGRLVRQVTPTGRVTTWGYDDSGVMTRVVAGRYAINIDIDTAGQETSRHVVAAPEPAQPTTVFPSGLNMGPTIAPTQAAPPAQTPPGMGLSITSTWSAAGRRLSHHAVTSPPDNPAGRASPTDALPAIAGASYQWNHTGDWG